MNAYSHYKYTFLLVALLLVTGTRMALVDSWLNDLIVDSMSALLMLAAIMAVCAEKHFRIAGFTIGLPVIALMYGHYLVPQSATFAANLAGRIGASSFLAFTVGMIVRSVLTARAVTWDTVVGSFAGYVLIGVIWTQLYCLVSLLNPGAFAANGVPWTETAINADRLAVCEYFSFATLSTVGYGDITPVSPVARSLATFEAICGQFYLAVLVAGLIGIRVPRSQAQTQDDKNSEV